MRLRYLLLAIFIFSLPILWVVSKTEINDQPLREAEINEEGLDGPGQFVLFHKLIRTPEDAIEPQYPRGFKIRELEQAKSYAQRQRSTARTQSNGVVEWTERGPANVPGRTRAIIVDPDDATKNTWYAGSAGGGVWKTTTGGFAWTLLTPDLANLATTVLAMAPSNHNIIYLGTGESFGGLVGIRGSGMFKSTDRGQTWNYITSTNNFSDVNRIAIDPANENILVVATADGIFRTANGGATWNQVSSRLSIEDLRATPGNFNIQYATQNGVGVIKSTNGGVTWALSNSGMSPSGRIEIAISPVNTNRIFASAQGALSGTQSDLYISDDAGATWSVVNVSINNAVVDFLGGQGWYDNTIMCDPFNADLVYHGGVGIFRTQLATGSTTVNSFSLDEQNTTFLSLVNFDASFAGGRLEVGSMATANIELRFGTGKSQKAHRFLVPVGSSSGVSDINYSYADYVDVPFEVWDVTNNRQLMVSFRDQDRNGQFNLLLQNTEGEATTQSREYIYINNVDYNANTPTPNIASNGGHIFQEIYFFWPVLAAGKTWPNDITTSQLKINLSSLQKRNATTITVADPYSAFDGKNKFNTFGVDLHPDQHNLVAVPMSATTYKIINASDGGVVVSNESATPGISSGDWAVVGRTYNTSQFYGADKRPGFDEYFGGLQDNGTWKTPAGTQSSSTTNFQFSFGGDGFEVVWHKLDDKKLIGGSQNNGFVRSVDGGVTWSAATTGLSGTHPFVSKLSNSKDNPDVLFTLSSAGVFRSTNFGANWTLTPIAEKWGGSTSLMDVEVSKANANIVWAGSGMTNTGTLRNLHVSTDGGTTFNPSNNYTDQIMGGITKLASHPAEDSTAYAIFSFAGKPKILRTKDLGNTWQDISGFGAGTASITGFPDVAVYCLYVRPDNTNIIWAGTEIGIVESLDNGQTWMLLDDFPNVSVWDMKGQDNQVVIATHGRGIWTATIDAELSTLKNPKITGIGTSPQSDLALAISLEDSFDSTQVFLDGIKAGKIGSRTAGNFVLKIKGVIKGTVQAKLISYKSKAPFHSPTVSGQNLQLNAYQKQYFNYFQSSSDLVLESFTVQSFGSSNTSLQTFHNYPLNANLIAFLKQPIIVTSDHPFFFYRDVAIVEPSAAGSIFGQPQFKDFVVVEGTKDGVTWIPLKDGYNASLNSSWLSSYASVQAGKSNQQVDHDIDLTTKFSVGDTLLFRFRLYSDNAIASWGWSVDDLYIQQIPTGVEPIKSLSAWSVYPNPTRGEITLSYTLTQKSSVEVLIFDSTGKVVINKALGQKERGEHTENLNLPSHAGTYLVQIQTPLSKKVLKVIVKN
jgi:photosystem II stability/assembly factor-like uncharacterized protein